LESNAHLQRCPEIGEFSQSTLIKLIDHEVDDDACDADVEPQGEGPAGDSAMFVEAFEEGEAEGD
jgi:hypothetical protein